MARLIKMDPARQLLFMRLRDKMSAGSLWKSSRAVFSPALLRARLQLTQPGTTRGFFAQPAETARCFAGVASTGRRALGLFVRRDATVGLVTSLRLSASAGR